MSSANLKLVRSIYTEWEQGDWSSTWWADPQLVVIMDDGLSPTTHKGLPDVSEGWRTFLSTWKDLAVVVDGYRELEDGRILALIRNTGRGKLSGVEVEATGHKSANLFELRDGKVIKLSTYWDRQRALDELGLTDRSPSGGT